MNLLPVEWLTSGMITKPLGFAHSFMAVVASGALQFGSWVRGIFGFAGRRYSSTASLTYSFCPSSISNRITLSEHQDAISYRLTCDSPSSRRTAGVQFIISARKTSRLVDELKAADWKRSPQTDANGQCEFRYQPDGWGKAHRFIALRYQKKPKPRKAANRLGNRQKNQD